MSRGMVLLVPLCDGVEGLCEDSLLLADSVDRAVSWDSSPLFNSVLALPTSLIISSYSW